MNSIEFFWGKNWRLERRQTPFVPGGTAQTRRWHRSLRAADDEVPDLLIDHPHSNGAFPRVSSSQDNRLQGIQLLRS